MLANLSHLLEKYSLEELRDYLAGQYEKNLFEIYEGMLTLILNEDKDKLKILSKEVEKIKKDFGFMFDNDGTIEEYVNMVMNGLQKLIDELKKNEEEFYKEVLNSDNPNFLITAYYSLYLRFVTTVYLKLHRINTKTTKDSRIKDIFNIANFLVGFFGMPILIYIKKKEVFPYISDLSGALLHALVADRTPIPSKDSLGYYLFSKIHALK
jgi:glutathionyl-hydroquinone reductase